MHKRYLLALLSMWMALPVSAEVWDGTREGATATTTGAITNSTNASQIDDHIRADRQEIRYRAEVEHCFGPVTTGCFDSGGGGSQTEDHGRHREGSGRCFFQAAAPTVINVVGDYDNTARASADGSQVLDDARCWVDSDDFTLHVYDEANTAWRSLTKTSGNLVYGGSFEQTDGTGDTTGCNDAGTPCVDANVAGWTVNGTTPDIAWTTAPVSEGGGLDIQITASGTTDEGIAQVLGAGGVKPTTTYLVFGRIEPGGAGDSCTLTLDDGTTTLDLTQSSGTAYVTKAGFFTTTAVPAAVTVVAEADTDTDICSFDHISVFEMGNLGQYQPGVMAFRETSGDDASNCDTTYTGCGAIAAVTVEPPSPNYIVQINAWVHMVAGAGDSCKARIYDGSSTLGERFAQIGIAPGPIELSYLSIAPLVAGTPITFQLDAGEAAGGDICVTDNDVGSTNEATHGIEVLLIPTR